MKTVVILSSDNSDMVEYFQCKAQMDADDLQLLFASPKTVDNPSKLWFSISGKNAVSLEILPNAFMSIALFFRLLIRGFDAALFENAHINNIFFAVLCKIFKKRLFLTIHDLEPHPGSGHLAVSLYNSFAYRLADKVIIFNNAAPNQKLVRTRLSGMKEGRVVKGKKQTVLFFGRFENYKGLSLIPIIARKLGEVSDLVVVVAGKGHCPDELREARLKNLKVINRYIDDEELDALYGNACCTILPYTSATQSGVVLKSYSYGVPVVAFDVGALSEYVYPRVSTLVPSGDIDGFVQAVLDISQTDHSGVISELFAQTYSTRAGEKEFRSLLARLSA